MCLFSKNVQTKCIHLLSSYTSLSGCYTSIVTCTDFSFIVYVRGMLECSTLFLYFFFSATHTKIGYAHTPTHIRIRTRTQTLNPN